MPSLADSFLPGLAQEEIQRAVYDLHLYVPNEIYELYRWRNGKSAFNTACEGVHFSYLWLLPFTLALEKYHELKRYPYNETPICFEGKSLFPFAEFDDDILTVLMTDKSSESSQVLWIPSESVSKPQLMYSNLTSMALTLSESYESGAFFVDGDGFIDSIDVKTAEILRRHNPDINEFYISCSRKLFINRELTSDILEDIKLISESLVRFKDPEVINILSNFYCSLVSVLSENSEYCRMKIVEILGQFYDVKVIPLLVSALHDRSAGVRHTAEESFANLRNLSPSEDSPLLMLIQEVVDPLISSLEIIDIVPTGYTHAANIILSSNVIEQVFQALLHHDELVRKEAVLLLGETNNPMVIEPLVRMLNDPSPLVRETAQAALAKIR
ncbi:MAG: HEAT repeat domain-containing protein [Synechococcaceae cyanobacterium SM2_3_1]|nr:HEAT repeat domain-containing protein [Synechococcaceae cyanobacterium SM2_3_1]